MSSLSTTIVRFGPFEMDLQSGELRKNGLKLRLPEQSFQVLKVLLAKAGSPVTREELCRALWPEGIHVDFERSLNQAVARLRETLEDSRDAPSFIETLPRHGYRFVAPVERIESATDSQQTGGTPSQPARRPWLLVTLLVGLLAGAVLLTLLVRISPFGWREWLLRQSTARPNIHSLAVLPLENLSGDREEDYFAEALTEELITDLAKIRELRVISRTSVMRYRGTSKPIEEIARELKVDAVVEGTVLRSGAQVHITAQLIQARPETNLWAESYSRPMGDLVALESEVVREIAGAIRLTLTPAERAGLSHTHAVQPEAYQAYLQGRFFWNKRTPEGLSRSIEYFQQSVDKDPLYAAAYAGLADAYALIGGYGVVSQEETIPKARAAATKALSMDETLAEAHASLGLIAATYDWNWAEADREFRRAIELNPSYATAHHWYGEAYLVEQGQFDEAIAEMQRAQELDPLSAIIDVDSGVVYYFGRRYDAAIAEFRKALALDAHFQLAHVLLARVYEQKRMWPEAVNELESIVASNGSLYALSELGRLYAETGRRDQARNILRQLQQASGGKHVDSAFVAQLFIGLGEKDQAFEWLEKEYAERSTGLTSLKVNPIYDPLRSDPRFQDLLRRVGLAP